MGKIVCLMGKSSSGKDTIFKELQKQEKFGFKTVVPYTTRPIREGEKEGVEYHFTDEEGFQKLKASGRIIEDRSYPSYHGLWRYFTVDDGQFQLEKDHYLMIGTPEAYRKMVSFFGQDKMVPVLICLDDGERLQRALNRERAQKEPKYEEMCRRFLADSVDFSREKIEEAGIPCSFYNGELDKCLEEIINYITAQL